METSIAVKKNIKKFQHPLQLEEGKLPEQDVQCTNGGA